MHQRLGDLERVVAHLTQQARATPVPIQESPPKAASTAETATESSAAHLRFQIHKMPPVLPHRRKGMLFQVLSPTLRVVLFKVQDLVTVPQLIQGTLVDCYKSTSRRPADVRVQVTALAEMVQQLSQLVANQVAPPPPPPAAPPPCLPCPLQGRRLRQKLATAFVFRQYQSQCWEDCTRHPHKRHRPQAPTHHQMTILHNVEFAAAAMTTRNAHTSP